MFNFPFYRPIVINKNLKDYIKKSNDDYLNNIKKKYILNNMNKEHKSDYEFNFCDLSDCGSDCSGTSDTTDSSQICIYNRNNYFSFILAILGGTSIVSLSLLYYNVYIKK
jgi:hypothetical protein